MRCVYVCACLCVSVCVCVCVDFPLTQDVSIHVSLTYKNFESSLFNQACLQLHTGPWLSYQSEILCTGLTGENKRKQSRGWMEICGCYEMIYTNGHMRYGLWKSQLSQSQCVVRRDLVNHGECTYGIGCPAGREADVLSGVFPGTQRIIHGSVWQSPFVSLCLPVCHSHTTKLWLQE